MTPLEEARSSNAWRGGRLFGLLYSGSRPSSDWFCPLGLLHHSDRERTLHFYGPLLEVEISLPQVVNPLPEVGIPLQVPLQFCGKARTRHGPLLKWRGPRIQILGPRHLYSGADPLQIRGPRQPGSSASVLFYGFSTEHFGLSVSRG